jgi:hypothetical protein
MIDVIAKGQKIFVFKVTGGIHCVGIRMFPIDTPKRLKMPEVMDVPFRGVPNTMTDFGAPSPKGCAPTFWSPVCAAPSRWTLVLLCYSL